MTKLNTYVAIAVAGLALAGAGCKKDKAGGEAAGSGSATTTPAGSGTATTPAGSGTATVPAGSGSATAPAGDTADKLEIHAKHVDPKKPAVTVTFTGVKVVKATFDPEKIEGGTAEIEIDVGSLATGVDDRDEHLKSNSYLDLPKFPTVSIKVDNVKKTGDNAYSADATVKAHGIEKKLPVTFMVTDKTADSIRISGEATFSRLDFGVGKAEAEETSKADMSAVLEVTLKKS